MPSKKRFTKKQIFFILLLLGLGALFFQRNFFGNPRESQTFGAAAEKKVTLSDGGFFFEVSSQTATVGDFLQEQKIKLSDHDMVYPQVDEKVFSGSNIIIQRAKKITIKEGGKSRDVYSLQSTVEQAIWENKDIVLGDDDITLPSRQTLLKNDLKIAVTHVLIKEEIKDEPISFKTVTNEDDKLGWRIKKTTQKGVAGNRQVKYKVVFYDGKEISRKVLEKNITQDPVDEIVTQGTFVKTGKAYDGVSSWYAYTGTMAAANPWLPMGSYVKVTNKDNSKSVIVKINDRGPFGNGRIIDLDKVAFEKIASLGQGTANIKMEVVLN